MILFRLVLFVLTAILTTTGLVLAVLALLTAGWLTVATVVVLAMAFIWAVLKGLTLISAHSFRKGT